MTTLKKTNAIPKGSDLIVICNKWNNNPAYGMDAATSNFIDSEIKNKEKKFICINLLGRVIAVAVVDTKRETAQSVEAQRKNGSSICDALNANKSKLAAIINETSNSAYSKAIGEGMALANYQFLRHKPSGAKNINTIETILVNDKKVRDAELNAINIVVDATCKARDLVNEPVNILNAEALAEAFKKFGKQAGFKVEVWNKAKIVEKKMGGLLSVNQGSVDPPTFTIMEYKPARPKNKKPFVIVGKGVVYDTGGLSIKPTPNSMDMMKCDMGGGAAVGATMYAIAKAKLNVHVIGLVPATDNRPGFNAFAPGDIITMMDGSTVEMLNSDAEGRMILADALHYAKKFEPQLTIDLATLTGAAAAAIGPLGIVGMGNANEQQKQKIRNSGDNVYERIAEFPFWDEYHELMKSDIADMKNLGPGYGGAITAGKFLEKFTNYPYYHLDIAAPAFLTAKDSYRGKGGTGVGVRLLFDFFSKQN